jgi:hypothetical protein
VRSAPLFVRRIESPRKRRGGEIPRGRGEEERSCARRRDVEIELDAGRDVSSVNIQGATVD